jgi:limonene 1,2-monooxygenase
VAPFHDMDQDPTLAMQHDLELMEWLDRLGFDEVWIGEHHSSPGLRRRSSTRSA